MKIRFGFVSNSSSSSFIVVLNDTNRHLANYNYMVKEREVIFERDNNAGDFEAQKEAQLLNDGWVFEKHSFFGRTKIKNYIKDIPIGKTNELDLGRYTSICFGNDLIKYIKFLRKKATCDGDSFEYLGNLANDIQDIISEYGLDNILFFRDSDENMGGQLPEELKALENTAVWAQEYH